MSKGEEQRSRGKAFWLCIVRSRTPHLQPGLTQVGDVAFVNGLWLVHRRPPIAKSNRRESSKPCQKDLVKRETLTSPRVD